MGLNDIELELQEEPGSCLMFYGMLIIKAKS